MTSEKHQPFEQNTRKEEKVMAQNIRGHSDEVGQHTGTNSIENDKEITELLSSECSKGRTMGCKTQNKKVKSFPRCLKIGTFLLVVKNISKLKLEENWFNKIN